MLVSRCTNLKVTSETPVLQLTNTIFSISKVEHVSFQLATKTIEKSFESKCTIVILLKCHICVRVDLVVI